MTAPSVRLEPTSKVTELWPSSFAEACAAVGLKSGTVAALWEAAMKGLMLTTETVLQLSGGRETLAKEYEDALRANPAGELAYAPGQNKDVDDSIALAIETRFPRATKVVRNEITVNGCTVWFSVDQESYFVESAESGVRSVGSAAAACAACDSGAGADALYPVVVALREVPVVTVPADDARAEMKR